MREEVEYAIKESQNGKSEGIDNIPIELIKHLGEVGMDKIIKLCNKIYESGNWPDDFLKTVLIPIPKRGKPTKCQDYRTISLLSHTSKILLKILNRRLIGKLDRYMGEEQFGFRKGKGTRDAIGTLRVICERFLEKGRSVTVCFVDLEKAFDKVNWDKLVYILKRKGVDWRDRRLIANLYKQQKAIVRIKGNNSEEIEIHKGVRQGCNLSPLLFNIYLEEMINEHLNDTEGLRIGGRVINCLRFADENGSLGRK